MKRRWIGRFILFLSRQSLLNERSRYKNSKISLQSDHHLCCLHEGSLDARVKFDKIGFSIGKSENIGFFRKYSIQ